MKEVHRPAGKSSLDFIYEQIGTEAFPCDCFCIACKIKLNPDHDIFVDDDGLNKGIPYFFEYEGAVQPFAGNGLVTASDQEGEGIAVTMSLEEIKKKVSFLSLADIHLKIQRGEIA